MNEPTDAELLREASRGSRDALERIARRYVGFVYNAALRQVHDNTHLAEDVTQAVFVILSRKIHHMKPGTLLHGWLFTTTRYAAGNARKMRKRRTHYERIAAGMRREEVAAPAPACEITPMLDEALADLREPDRCAVLLSYFGGKTYREVGAEIGTTEEGARKRVERAVERMRRFFAQRGAAVTGAGVVAALRHSAQAAAPPPGLVESIASCMAASSVTAAPLSGLAKGVIYMMTWTQTKVAATVAAVVVMTTLVGAGAAMMGHTSSSAEEKTAAPPADAVVELANDTKVELLGVSKQPSKGGAWWHADGTPAAAPYGGSDGSNGTIGNDPDDAREVVLRVTGPNIDELGVKIELANRPGWTSGGLEGLDSGRLISFAAQKQESADVRVTVATGPWETILSQQPSGFRSDRHVVFSPAVDEEGCVVTTSDDLIDHQARVVAIGNDGQTYASSAHMIGFTKSFRQMTTRFPLGKDEIDRFEFQARPFDQFVMFKNVSLTAGKNAGFKAESGKLEPKPTDK